MSKFKISVILIIIFIFTLFLINVYTDEPASGKTLIELRTYEEIQQMLQLKLKPMDQRENVVRFDPECLQGLKLPPSYDLRAQNALTPIKDQDGCGGCWAFAPVGLFEGLIRMMTGKITDLAEQQLIDCIPSGSCSSGGWPPDAMDYMRDNGIVLEQYYPLTYIDGPCNVQRPSDYYLTEWAEIDVWYGSNSISNRIKNIKNAIYSYGPVVVAMEVTDDFAYNYTGGVYVYNGDLSGPNHAVCIVGWKDDAAITNGGYWIVRNSWGTAWGENGYCRIAYGQVYIDGYLCCYGEFLENNHPPIFDEQIEDKEGREGTQISFTASATDAEDDPITYSSDSLPSGATYDSKTGEFTWTPDYTQAGTYDITLTASDGNLSSSQTFTINVKNVKQITK